ncbi:MAG: DUF4367 domain-containing protein [Eubacteriales bacterium]|nr:DUF4367 domain-containing protein [Eubacteriales bacterium]
MREQFDDYEKKIMEKIDREAEEIQRSLNEDPQVRNIKVNEQLDQKVYARIEEYEKAVAKRNSREDASTDANEADDITLAGLSEENREALRLGKELMRRREEKERRKAARRNAGMWKRFVAAVVVLILLVGTGVNSIGGPERVVEMVTSTFNGREVSKVNSSKDNVKNDGSEEEQAYQQIKDELGIDPVKIFPVLKEMKYKYCEIDEDIRMVQLLYEYRERNISYLIDASYTKETWGTDIEDHKIDEYIYTTEKLKAEITEYELSKSKEKEYTAEFEYKGIYYQLTAVMSWEQFEEILKNLHFPV